jgi:hypothetical protein
MLALAAPSLLRSDHGNECRISLAYFQFKVFSRGGNLDKSNDKASDKKPDIEAIKLVDKFFNEAKQYRATREEEWAECEDFYHGKHWKDKNRSHKNLIFPIIEQEIATLTDSMPGTDVLAYKDGQEEAAKIMESGIHFVYEQENLFLKQSMAIRAALKVGTGFHYVDFDPDADHGQGKVMIKVVPWRHVYLDPAASEIDEAAFVGLKFPMRVEELKRKFPKHADKIKPQDDNSIGESTWSKGLREQQANYGATSSAEERFKLEGMATLEEAWLRDFEMVDIPEDETIAEIEKETEEFFKGINPDITRFEHHERHIEAHYAQKRSIAAEALGLDPAQVTEQDIESLKEDPELGLVLLMIEDHIKIHQQYQQTNPDNKKPKFSEGLRLIMKVGDVLLYDGDAPVEDGLVPLVPYYCYKDEDIWGTGEVKHILPAQKSFNEMDNAEYESLHLTSNPGWVMDANAGVNPSSITNKRGQVYIVNPSARFQRLEPGTTSPQLSQRKHSDQQYMEIISGINEASQGRRPGGITAAKAIERLQQQTNGRIRLKSAYLQMYSMRRLGMLVASRISKYWTVERCLRITDSTSGEVRRVIFDPDKIKNLEYEVRVVPGTLSGTDKEAQAEVMAAYVEKGWIPPKVYFQVVDVPNKKKVLEALEEADQQRAMLEQLMAENEQLKAMINGVPAEPSMPAQMAPQA